jgi:signal transduction histidine kinase
MSKIPFTVSARTARLIGRENIASSKGAIIELVKNCYDADSKICMVYFDNYFSILHEAISLKEYEFLLQNAISEALLNRVYERQNTQYSLNPLIRDEDRVQIKTDLKKLTTLYIIDAGEGMTTEIIQKHWMTIGTDNKANNVFTKTGRVRSGAKGIGRFALDKLGDTCTMITSHINASTNGIIWKVDWRDFEGEFKTIDKVEAELIKFDDLDLNLEIKNRIHNLDILNLIKKHPLQHGTILEVSNLRENWEDFFVNQIFSDLEQSIPPEKDNFNIFLYSSLATKKYGEVLGSLCDDYDYKLVAKADEKQNIKITVYRNEYDKEAIDPNFFKQNNLSHYPYREQEFEHWELEKTFSQLLPGFKEVDEDKVFNDIGVFEFTLYFMKKTYTTKDAEKFFYRKFRANERKGWLDNFGGIKLFRDNFRVRPYGEAKSTSFDWLGLGARKSQSPAGIAKEGGGYRVNPDNVAGTIKISRLTNVNFEDKSSREGLQENKTFLIFKNIITGIIGIFEKDRAYIAREMSVFYDEKYSDKIDREKAEKLAKSILSKKNKEQGIDKKNNEAVILAELNEVKTEVIEKLEDEQKILRGLASSGIVIASFSHDFGKLSNVLNSRIDKLKKIISENILEEDFKNTEDRKNPFKHLEKMKKQDLKLQNWLQFSLGVARKDKRKRKQLNFYSYFNNYKNDWQEILNNRGINFDISNVERLNIRAFEIDIDSIFNNLLINSIDSFNSSTIDRARKIIIDMHSTTNEIIINYYDNGMGLSKDIEQPNQIFEPLYTTKRNQHTGDEEGTGLGMWLIKSIVEDNAGKIKLLFPKEGFGMQITFPKKYENKKHV